MEEGLIMNAPRKYINDKIADTLRGAIENEGKWVYYLTSEGLNCGLDAGFAKDAMKELGEYYAGTVYASCENAEQIAQTLMNRAMELGHEAEIADLTDAGFDLIVGYCPMLNMWNQLCEDDDKKKLLCDVACSMYAGLGAKLGMKVEKQCAIAHGCENCKLCFRKA